MEKVVYFFPNEAVYILSGSGPVRRSSQTGESVLKNKFII